MYKLTFSLCQVMTSSSHAVSGTLVRQSEKSMELLFESVICRDIIVVLENTLESPLECKEIKLVNLKEINPEYLLEGLMLKLKLRNFGHPMRRADSLEKTLMLGKIEGRRRS